ncbi:RDD family protein [Campylobacter sp. LR264d]|uniref:RDD family protein n=1 Tax=Campylobacter sp. LR264d TaxID=2593544 RepID=UPI0012393A00|nr:RDD family protein [Campylobacter sp. LR264d]KAA6231446.1 RDD family protein [Campylobacter sp. LR264d]
MVRASRVERMKAFLIDLFLLYVPLLYISYFILGSAAEFRKSQLSIFICVLGFGFLQGLFFLKSAQSPGLKAYGLYLIDLKTGKKLKILKIILRYFAFIISCAILFGIIISLFRKDGLTAYDLISQSCIVKKEKDYEEKKNLQS